MLKTRAIFFSARRSNGNFVQSMGLWERTAVQEYAKRSALVADENTQLTYDQLNNRIGQYASLLSSKYRIQKGDRLLSRTTKTLDTAALYFATLRLGAIYIPLNPGYTTKETKHFVNDGEPKIMVTCEPTGDQEFVGTIGHVVDENILAKEANKEQPILECENVSNDEIATILYTSGTTGLPKGAMLTHGNLTSNSEVLADIWHFTKNDVLSHLLPFYHIHGMIVCMGATLASKSTQIFRPKFELHDALKWMPKSTVFIGVPTFYTRLMSDTEAFNRDAFKNIRVFICGSAPLTAAVWESFRKHTGQPILERYGMSETLVSISNPYEPTKRIPGSVGIPVPGTNVRLGPNNVIEVKGPSVFKGYWKLPEKTKKEFTNDGYFQTGDVGEVDENGYYKIMAREKDMIISGGFNVYPKEVEDTIDALDLVKEVAIIGVPHPDFGEAVVAVCIPKTGKTSDDLAVKLKSEVKSRLANYKRPKKYLFVEDYPRNFIGKVQKNKLRDQYKNLFA
ncbi:hypothetical protein M3Y98_00974700 [Aphelenchoides besseyi]|nr:hypothetical protein M3Y98_00974700 [Aphelenchoides besseyi]KAI6194980.1 hypothetical protein M3Y96_01182500 [Aphelenchoides besseyi]